MVLLLAVLSYGFLLHLPGGREHEQCFSVMAHGKTRHAELVMRFAIVQTRMSSGMDCRIISPSSKEIYTVRKVQHGSFLQRVYEEGKYEVCFVRRRKSRITVQIEFDFDARSFGSRLATLDADTAVQVKKGELHPVWESSSFEVGPVRTTATLLRFDLTAFPESVNDVYKNKWKAFFRVHVDDTFAHASPRHPDLKLTHFYSRDVLLHTLGSQHVDMKNWKWTPRDITFDTSPAQGHIVDTASWSEADHMALFDVTDIVKEVLEDTGSAKQLTLGINTVDGIGRIFAQNQDDTNLFPVIEIMLLDSFLVVESSTLYKETFLARTTQTLFNAQTNYLDQCKSTASYLILVVAKRTNKTHFIMNVLIFVLLLAFTGVKLVYIRSMVEGEPRIYRRRWRK